MDGNGRFMDVMDKQWTKLWGWFFLATITVILLTSPSIQAPIAQSDRVPGFEPGG